MREAFLGVKLLVDRTLGRLVRWLRLLGYDAAWDAQAGQAELLARAECEDRILLTRDTLLVERRAVRRGRVRAVLVRGDLLAAQLEQLRTEEGLHRVGPPRCLVCGSRLLPMTPDEVHARVPPYVAATQHVFTYCPVCDRITWPATHWDDMRRRLVEAGFAEPAEPGG
jgi:uncharacterized protein with PIN domain